MRHDDLSNNVSDCILELSHILFSGILNQAMPNSLVTLLEAFPARISALKHATKT